MTDSTSRRNREAYIARRATQLAAEYPFNEIADPGRRVRAARCEAGGEWRQRRQYEHTEIARTDAGGHPDPEGGCATVRNRAGSGVWSVTYTPAELADLGEDIAAYLAEIGYTPEAGQ